MLTVIEILTIWSLLSLPLAMVLGFSFKDDRLELVGMDGADVVYRRTSGQLERVRLIDTAAV